MSTPEKQTTDASTGEWIDGGADIPLEQILAAPRRGTLTFEADDPEGDRSIGQMMRGSLPGMPPLVKASGWKANKSHGWKGLNKGQIVAYQGGGSRKLQIAGVMYNDRANQRVEAHSYRSLWIGMSVVHKKEYRRTDAEGSSVVLEPTEEPVKTSIPYRALIKVVELHMDGRMFQGDATTLSKGGWTYRIDADESVRAVAAAVATVVPAQA